MADWPYNTDAWRRVRRLKLHQQPTCEYCPTGRLTVATEVDHKLAVKHGGDPFDLTNLASACKPCHSRKTMLEERWKGRRTRPRGGCDAAGNPIDPDHWWRQ